MKRWICLVVGLLAVSSLLGQETGPAATAAPVQVTGKALATGPERVEWAYTFTCGAEESLPTLRLALGKFSDFSISAGQSMAATDNGGSVATVSLRIEMQDAAKGTFLLSVEIGPDGPMVFSRAMALDEGSSLGNAVQLNVPRETSDFRRSIGLGNVAGCTLSAYVMPGRQSTTRAKPTPQVTPPSDGAPVAMFSDWVRGVKDNDLEKFSQAYPPEEWQRLSLEDRSKRLSEFRQAFTTVLGEDFAPGEIKAAYKGGAVSGKLSVTYGDKALPDLGVQLLGGRWVLSDR